MGDIPAGWQAVIALVFSALAGAVGWIFQTRRTDRLAESARKDAVIAAQQATIERLQNEKLEFVKEQLDLANKRRETDDRIARSLEDLSNAQRIKSGAA